MAEPTPVGEREAPNAAALDRLLCANGGPFVVRGLAAHWPLVEAGLRSARDARSYLLAHARNRDFPLASAEPEADGRLFYDADMQVNFRMGQGPLGKIFAGFDAAETHPRVPTVYLGSIDIGQYFDRLDRDNRIELGARDPIASIWIGNETRIAAHNDFPDNVAVCAVGQRRFTLFPPEQFANLYLGPLDNTPAGRAISMVDHDNPDFDLHPRYREALASAQVAELEPGDALHIPSGWYHRVEALARFNVLVNYWWRESPRWMGEPQEALLHAILSLRGLPEAQRAVWRQMFDHYVFSGGAEAARHLPDGTRGVLDPLDVHSAGRLRAFLLRSLSR